MFKAEAGRADRQRYVKPPTAQAHCTRRCVLAWAASRFPKGQAAKKDGAPVIGWQGGRAVLRLSLSACLRRPWTLNSPPDRLMHQSLSLQRQATNLHKARDSSGMTGIFT
ncbi:hypothetical protein DPEC_G00233360 [Dallia pectoralis]|uniref:Uncharacterized protein n=1 Tax=Dallia pectoralis TaxID=75939 RepID=A0ACC2FXX9_DALPE|nr:hypothetical protein DPEC_G00233360 [Dallia pectoralis]